MASGGAGGLSSGSGGAGGTHEVDDPIDDQVCVVAQRIDACCPTWVAVEHGEARTQPCLVEIGEPQPSQKERTQCAPQVCTNVLCPEENEPPTRVAFKGDGMCMLGDECFGPGECTIAYDATACCPCPESMPKSHRRARAVPRARRHVGARNVPAGGLRAVRAVRAGRGAQLPNHRRAHPLQVDHAPIGFWPRPLHPNTSKACRTANRRLARAIFDVLFAGRGRIARDRTTRR